MSALTDEARDYINAPQHRPTRMVRRLLAEVEDLERWKETASIVLENVKLNDMPALEVIELAWSRAGG